MLRVMDLTAKRKGEPPWPDPEWRYRFYGGGYSTSAALLAAVETALAELARGAPEDFVAVVDRLKENQFETAQYLQMRAYAANGVRVANVGADYLS